MSLRDFGCKDSANRAKYEINRLIFISEMPLLGRICRSVGFAIMSGKNNSFQTLSSLFSWQCMEKGMLRKAAEDAAHAKSPNKIWFFARFALTLHPI